MSNRVIILGFDKNPVLGEVCRAWTAELENDEQGSSLDFLYRTIGCVGVDVVSITAGDGSEIDIWVDDLGLYADHPKPNWAATQLRNARYLGGAAYRMPCNMPPLMGVAVLAGVDDEGNTVGLTDSQIEYIKSALHGCFFTKKEAA